MYSNGTCPPENVAIAIWARDWDMDLDTRRRLLAIARTNTLSCVKVTGLAYTLENSECVSDNVALM